MSRVSRFFPAAVLISLLLSCSSGEKRTTPRLSEMEGKKVALVELEAEQTSRRMVEVALVNQLTKHGSFELLSQQSVQDAKVAPDVDSSDFKAVARKAGADYALKARVLELSADEKEGYDRVTVEDSQLAAERGEKERMTERLVKVKSLTARVRVELEFADLAKGETRRAVAEHVESVTENAEKKAIRLPPKLRFLEAAVNQALAKFFQDYAD